MQMERSSLMMPECVSMARGRTLQTYENMYFMCPFILHDFSVCPAWDSSSALGGVAGWIGTNLCFPLFSFACLPGYSFCPWSLLLPNLGTAVWGGKAAPTLPRASVQGAPGQHCSSLAHGSG